MTTMALTVLEYAQSDLDKAGIPLLIIIRDEDEAISPVHSFILKNWKQLVPSMNNLDIEYIEDLVHELRQQEFRLRNDRENFFRTLERLSRGPLRVCLSTFLDQNGVEDLDLGTALRRDNVTDCEQQAFDEMLRRFFAEPNCQPTAM